MKNMTFEEVMAKIGFSDAVTDLVEALKSNSSI